MQSVGRHHRQAATAVIVVTPETLSPELMRAIRTTWDRAHRMVRPSFPPGLYEHRSLADAQKLADEGERANVARQRKRLGRSG